MAALALGVASYIYFRPKPVATEAKGKGPRATPVATTMARTSEFKVFLNALGTVAPLNSATVRSRVDGQLMKVRFTEGQVVQAGDLLAEIDARPFEVGLHQAEGQLARDTALWENAKLDLERYQKAKDAVTQQQLSTAEALVAQYGGIVKSDHAAVEGYQLQLSYCRITSPITGRVGLKVVDEGNLVRASDSAGVAVIVQEHPITVLFSVPEENVLALKKSLAAGKPLKVEALDRSAKTVLASGEVAALDNQIDAATGTVRLKAVFANEDDALFPNQFVNVRLLMETQPDALLVPASAVQISAQARFVFVVDEPTQTVSRRAVTVGRAEGDVVAVVGGLKPGEIVVADGLDKLQDGAKVSARPIGDASSVPAAAAGGDAKPKGQRKKKSAAPAP